MAKPSTSVESRFWSKVDKRGQNECWIWTGSLTKSGGYGQIARTRKEGPMRANRFAYELAYGPFDKNLFVLHRCDRPACVNPRHLYLDTQAENLRDMSRKKRWKNQHGAGENHEPFNQHLLQRRKVAH